jgi:CRISPR/Cas system-associated exonuclease Cas4 (RecB family)
LTTFQQVDVNHERSLTSQLRAYATEKALNRSIHGSGYFHCQLQQVFSLLGYEPTDKKYVWAWDLAARAGDAIHALVQQELIDSGKVLILPNGKPAIEVTLGKDTLPPEVAEQFLSYKMGVRVDAVGIGQEDSEIPIEIKTIGPEYLSGPKSKYLQDRLADYEMQLQLSLHWWRHTKTGERCNYGLIYIINRGDISQRLEYVIEYNAGLIDSELQRVANIRDHWLKTTLPEPEPQRGCTFCQFKTLCPAPAHLKK